MAKYLFIGSYNSEGAKGLRSGGGTTRRDQIAKMIEGAGGKLEAFYFAFGEGDVYAICELPDQATAAAISMAVCAGGAASARTVVLLTPEVMDEAAARSVAYSPPGG